IDGELLESWQGAVHPQSHGPVGTDRVCTNRSGSIQGNGIVRFVEPWRRRIWEYGTMTDMVYSAKPRGVRAANANSKFARIDRYVSEYAPSASRSLIARNRDYGIFLDTASHVRVAGSARPPGFQTYF